ncbi:MAG: type II CAAX endopeptidase family protein [Hellea sp.]
MTGKDFYGDALRGETSTPIWIACLSIILVGFYIVIGAFGAILGTLVEFLEINWHPSYYNAEAKPQFLRYLWSVFYDWVPGTLLTIWALYYAQKHLRKRPFLKLITAAKSFRWKRLLAGIFVFGLLNSCYLLVLYLYPTGPEPALWSETVPKSGLNLQRTDLNLSWFLMVLPMLLIIVPINAFMQEAVFRGFLDQALVGKLKQTLPSFMISAGLFSLWHIYNYEIAFGAVPYLIGLFIFGFAMSVITSNDGGIEAAIGIHTANNIFYTLGIGHTIILLPDTFLLSFGEPNFSPGTVLANLTIYSLAVIILSKLKYGLNRNGPE